ncbi:MAG: class I SAM-dependent DNA methyltransferase [Candidatus Wallbacteria bacterium]|nr:class I SAM-dependent DNA methyltransferase [Candidatus Wallbacteria bacterium]
MVEIKIKQDRRSTVPLSINEIRSRALAFSKEWAEEKSENAEAQTFWNDFFHVFGFNRRRLASFEEPAKKSDGQGGFIDLLWRSVLLVEHKSRGKNLDKAFNQALDYFPGLKDRDLPRYILVSDFARFRLYDLENKAQHEFQLSELYKNIKLFNFIAGYRTEALKPEDPANIEAAELMGKLHDQLKEVGYAGHHLEVYLVRLLFCLFADDTAIFERGHFQDYIETKTQEDGSDLAQHLSTIFYILNTPEEQRLTNLDDHLASFPYVNGKLFSEQLPPAAFDSKMRQILLECAALDWSRISPAIFGSLFQSVMIPELRRNLGAHYTTEQNILKVIHPLFLDKLIGEFNKLKTKRSKAKLEEFHKRLAKLKFLDPACGCGNFLVISYRELRMLELEVLREIYKKEKNAVLEISHIVLLDVDQFFGIEIEEFPAQIAQVALWMTDHQMNMRISEEFGQYFSRLPLTKAPSIVCGNALQIDWSTIIKPTELSFILGNPPFIGHHLQIPSQKAEMLAIYGKEEKSAGVMDYVTAWYCKAVSYIKGTAIKVAYVSTNSITQGEQVGILWRALLRHNKVSIHFAHRTFKWTSEAKGKAAVYCVIIGFAEFDSDKKWLYEYESPDGEPHKIKVKNINAYLVDAPWILLDNQSKNQFGMPEMMYGNKPTDGGHFLFTDSEKEAFLLDEPLAAQFIKPFISAKEYLHGEKRWVVWLVGASPSEISSMPKVKDRIKAVEAFRKSSKAPTTQNYPYPSLFRQVTQPEEKYVLIPRHTSENRVYIPFGFFDKENIVADSCLSLPGATLFHFGILQSAMHMAWVRAVCGRLKGDYRYSKDIVYNNFPWPETSEKNILEIEKAAQQVLDARAQFPESCLADLYNVLTMPPVLMKAHKELDKVVDAAYGKVRFNSEAERVAFLFEMYKEKRS